MAGIKFFNNDFRHFLFSCRTKTFLITFSFIIKFVYLFKVNIHFFQKKTFGLLYLWFEFQLFVKKDCSKLQKHFLELESITPPLKITGLSNIPERGHSLKTHFFENLKPMSVSTSLIFPGSKVTILQKRHHRQQNLVLLLWGDKHVDYKPIKFYLYILYSKKNYNNQVKCFLQLLNQQCFKNYFHIFFYLFVFYSFFFHIKKFIIKNSKISWSTSHKIFNFIINMNYIRKSFFCPF